MSFDDPVAFIRANLPLAEMPEAPGLRLHLATPASRISRLVGDDGPAPYWAYVWAGGLALARYITDHPQVVAGRRVLDYGAGSGLCGLVAARSGATVLALETDPLGRAAIKCNATANDLSVTITEDIPPVDLILAGDVFYASEVAARSLAVLTQAQTRGADILIGDPWRTDLPTDHLTAIATYDVTEPTGRRRAGVFKLSGGGLVGADGLEPPTSSA